MLIVYCLIVMGFWLLAFGSWQLFLRIMAPLFKKLPEAKGHKPMAD